MIGLDFDALEGDHVTAKAELLKNPLISAYAAFAYTTASHTNDKPRFRVIFILDMPITKAGQYVEYATALVRLFPTSDQSVHDAARIWLGSPDAEIFLQQTDRRLPLSILDNIKAKQDKPTKDEPQLVTDVILNIEKRLGIAGYDGNGPVAVRCPFHDDDNPSAYWSRDSGGQLFCFAGCRPTEKDKSAGKNSFGWIDTAKKLGITIPDELVWFSEDDIKETTKSEKGFIEGFLPPLPLLLSSVKKPTKNKKRGRPTTYYALTNIQQTIDEIDDPHYRPLNKTDLQSAKFYRAKAYAPIESGMFTRNELTTPIGVSRPTALVYDKLVKIAVTPKTRTTKLTKDDEWRFSWNRDDYPISVWIESVEGQKFPPTVGGLRDALKQSVDYPEIVAYLVRRLPNHYEIPHFADNSVGLPLEIRRELIKAGQTALARVIDALLLAGVREGQTLTAKKITDICSRYGVSEWTVRTALKDVSQ